MHTKFNLHALLNRERRKRYITDAGLVLISLVGPISTIPQITKIFATQSAADLSLVSWVLYLATALGWLAYAIKLRSRPLLVNNILWSVVYVGVIAGIIIHG